MPRHFNINIENCKLQRILCVGVQQTKFTTRLLPKTPPRCYCIFSYIRSFVLTKLFFARVLQYRNIYEHNPNICLMFFSLSLVAVVPCGTIFHRQFRKNAVGRRRKSTSFGTLVEFRSNFIFLVLFILLFAMHYTIVQRWLKNYFVCVLYTHLLLRSIPFFSCLLCPTVVYVISFYSLLFSSLLYGLWVQLLLACRLPAFVENAHSHTSIVCNAVLVEMNRIELNRCHCCCCCFSGVIVLLSFLVL